MRRRDLLGGIGSVGVLGVAGIVHLYGTPFGATVGEEPPHDPVTVQGVTGPGSTAETFTIPDPDRITFVDLFATTCTVCQAQMPELGRAADSLDDVLFVSLTAEQEATVPDSELASWWEQYDGSWPVARDVTYDFVRHYTRATPTAVLFDAAGRLRWEETGAKTSDEIIDRVDAVRE